MTGHIMQPKAYQPMDPSQNMAVAQHLGAVLLTVVLTLFSSCHVTLQQLWNLLSSHSFPRSQACSFVPASRLFQDSPHCGILSVLGKGRVQLTSVFQKRKRQSTAPAVRGAEPSQSSCEGIFIVFANLFYLCLWLSVLLGLWWAEIPLL